jgi:hypothetical protein
MFVVSRGVVLVFVWGALALVGAAGDVEAPVVAPLVAPTSAPVLSAGFSVSTALSDIVSAGCSPRPHEISAIDATTMMTLIGPPPK